MLCSPRLLDVSIYVRVKFTTKSKSKKDNKRTGQPSIGRPYFFVPSRVRWVKSSWGEREAERDLRLWEYKLSGGWWGPVGPTLHVRARKLPHAPERGVRRPPRADPPPPEHEV
eukprot:scaffold9414_cov156-Isochrysis_galbana.AAC.5